MHNTRPGLKTCHSLFFLQKEALEQMTVYTAAMFTRFSHVQQFKVHIAWNQWHDQSPDSSEHIPTQVPVELIISATTMLYGKQFPISCDTLKMSCAGLYCCWRCNCMTQEFSALHSFFDALTSCPTNGDPEQADNSLHHCTLH